jgi:bacterioferritin-associated ferredoxin
MFWVDMDHAPGLAEVTIAYEMLPVPRKGDVWQAMDREGRMLGEATITRVNSARSLDRKHLVSFSVPKALAAKARHVAPSGRAPLAKLPPRRSQEDPIVCRCEDVRLSEIQRAIDAGCQTFEEVKRVLRTGMGPCQGKTCQQIILRMLSQKLHQSIGTLAPMKVRSPLRPVTLETMSEAFGEE